MRNRELSGWASSLIAARETWPRIPENVWRQVGEFEAPAGRTFVQSQNELFYEACKADLVRFPTGRR